MTRVSKAKTRTPRRAEPVPPVPTPPVPKHPLGANGNGYIVVPKWFVSFLSFLASVVFVSAVFWAWSISSDVSAIKAEVRAQTELRRTEFEDVRRRLDRHDELFDRIFQQK